MCIQDPYVIIQTRCVSDMQYGYSKQKNNLTRSKKLPPKQQHTMQESTACMTFVWCVQKNAGHLKTYSIPKKTDTTQNKHSINTRQTPDWHPNIMHSTHWHDISPNMVHAIPVNDACTCIRRYTMYIYIYILGFPRNAYALRGGLPCQDSRLSVWNAYSGTCRDDFDKSRVQEGTFAHWTRC